MDETLLIQQCRRGSAEAFEGIVKKYMKDAYYIAFGLVGNREDALDLSQEAFIRAYNNIGSFNLKWGFFPWFYRILRNLCFSHLRKRKNRQKLSLDELGEQNILLSNSSCTSPDVAIQRNEQQQRIWQAISKLDDKHREVIILRHFRDLSYEQMAKTLFCNKGTVTSRLYYARKRLKELLETQKGGR